MPGARSTLPLPARLPVFPLSGVVLMPFGHLPLNIFEPRYLHMVDDVLGAGRTIAMVQPCGPGAALGAPGENAPVSDDAPLYEVGSVGRIIQFSDPGNGCYLITLEGLSRFRLNGVSMAENGRGYRMVEADYQPFANDRTPPANTERHHRARIIELMRDYFHDQDIDADWQAIDEAPLSALVASLVMSCPFAAAEKQALLQCDSAETRAEMLIALFEMRDSLNFAHGTLKH